MSNTEIKYSNREIKFTKLPYIMTSSSLQSVDVIYFGENDGTVHKIYKGLSVGPKHHIAFMMFNVKTEQQIVGISTTEPKEEDEIFVGYYSANLV